MNGPDGKQEASKTNEYAYLVKIPKGKIAQFRFSENAGTEVAGLLYDAATDQRIHRSGNPRKEAKDTMDAPIAQVEGPKDVWVTGWFKQPGWKHDAAWQQQKLKVLLNKPDKEVELGFEDHWGNPGTGGNIDYNDLEVRVELS